MTSNSSQDWQVFISCKVSDENDEYTRDWYIAKELYELLKANSIRVFMSSFSIEEMGESFFMKAIADALNSSQIMVVVGTTNENICSRWVEIEWSSFYNAILSGRKKDAKIYTYIDNIRESELPLFLNSTQSFPVSRKNNLVKTIMTALGMNYTSTSLKTESEPTIKSITSRNGDELIYVEGGIFIMGDTWGDGFLNGNPPHEVELTYDFYIGKYEVTFDEYDRYCRESGATRPSASGFGRGQRPVINVSWNDATAYCNWLSEREKLPKAYDNDGNMLDKDGRVTTDITKVLGFRLPTEAEWEYAARGGNKSKGYKYSGSDNVDDVAWYWRNSGDKYLTGDWDLDTIMKNNCKTQEVGKKAPNELGIYDMSGNVYEWCSDCYQDYTLLFDFNSAQKNPYHIFDLLRAFRVNRGGSWLNGAADVRVVSRDGYSPTYTSFRTPGFRIARTVP